MAGAHIWRVGLFPAAAPLCAAAPGAPERAGIACPHACAPGSARPGRMIEIAQDVAGKAGHAVDDGTASPARREAGRAGGIAGPSPAASPGFVCPREALVLGSGNLAVRTGETFIHRGPASRGGKIAGAIRGNVLPGGIGAPTAGHGNIAMHGPAARVRVTTSVHAGPPFIALSPAPAPSRQPAGSRDAGMRRLRQAGRLARIPRACPVPVPL